MTSGLNPEDVVKLGFTMVPEGREIFGTLTVEENLRIGAYARRDWEGVERDFEMIIEELPHLKARLRGPAGLLSGGEQQMLAIGRGLMTAPRLIALDEPSLGLAPKIIDQVYEILLRLQKRRALTLVIGEQNLSRSIRVGARVVVLRSGRAVISGDARSMESDGSLERAYFGF
jgi:branched-chain amino acid transport system ATP-binding protein